MLTAHSQVRIHAPGAQLKGTPIKYHGDFI